jgi:hypothetical protein
MATRHRRVSGHPGAIFADELRGEDVEQSIRCGPRFVRLSWRNLWADIQFGKT